MSVNKYLQMEKRISLETQDEPLDQVSELILDYCYATRVSGLTEQFVNLESLSMIKVGLITLEGFPTLPKLKKLELCDNQLDGGLDCLSGSKDLRDLDMSGNNIQDMNTIKPLQIFSKLTNLYLCGCGVTNTTGYRKRVFDLLPNLTILDGSIQEEEVLDPPTKRPALESAQPTNYQGGADHPHGRGLADNRSTQDDNQIPKDDSQVKGISLEAKISKDNEFRIPERSNADQLLISDNMEDIATDEVRASELRVDSDVDVRMDVGHVADGANESEFIAPMNSSDQIPIENDIKSNLASESPADIVMNSEDGNLDGSDIVVLRTETINAQNEFDAVRSNSVEEEDGCSARYFQANKVDENIQTTPSENIDTNEEIQLNESNNVNVDIDMASNNISSTGVSDIIPKEDVSDGSNNDKTTIQSDRICDVVKKTADESVTACEPEITLNESGENLEEMSRVNDSSVEIIEEEDERQVDISADDASEEACCMIDEEGEYSDEGDDDGDEVEAGYEDDEEFDEEAEAEEEEEEEAEGEGEEEISERQSDLAITQRNISVKDIGSSEDLDGRGDSSYDGELSEGEIINGEDDDSNECDDDEQEVTQIYNASPSNPEE